MTTTLTIHDELKSLLPPLTAKESAGLEASLLKDGCIAPLVAWNDLLVDGHHRYEICSKHGIPFNVRQLEFESLDDAKLWAGKHQEHRRNLTPYHRSELALKIKAVIAAKAKERQMAGLKQNTVPLNSTERKETRQELAEIAGVAPSTIRQATYIAEHADEDTKEKLRNGEKGTSINKEYNRLKDEAKQAAAQTDTETLIDTPAQDESTVDSTPPASEMVDYDDQPTGIGLHCRPGEQPGSTGRERYVPKTTIKEIPHDDPTLLIGNLIAHFPQDFLPLAIEAGVHQMCCHQQYGQKAALELVRRILEDTKRYKETKRK